MQKEIKYLLLLSLFLLIKSGVILWVISTEVIGLGPDEAQYWTWSQALDWGYYSKPPGIAWQIWAGTQLWGNTEFGVRFLSVIMGIVLPLAVYALARACSLLPQTAFWAGMIMALSPVGVMGSMLAITDGGMMIFWTLACVVLLRGIDQGKAPSYVLIGFCVLLGALFKWPIYFFWVWVLFAWYFFPYVRSSSILPGVVISALGLFPSMVWNASHEWATFHHVFSTVKGGDVQTVVQGNLFEFIGAQAVLLSPLLFVLLLLALIYAFKSNLSPALFFCAFVSFATLVLFCGYAVFKKMQGNWCVFVYPTLIVYLSWFLCERIKWGKKALIVSLLFGIFLSGIGLSIPYVQKGNVMGDVPIPYRWNPFKHNVGWKELGLALESAGYNPQEHFLFGDRYQSSSLLSFYGPQQRRAYFLNLEGIRRNQFSFWPSMAEEQKGKTGFFASIENAPFQESKIADYKQRLAPYFKNVEFLGAYPLFYAYGKPVKEVLLFRGDFFSGKEPVESNLW